MSEVLASALLAQMRRRPAFVVACVPVLAKSALLLLPGSSALLWSWIPWLAIAAVVWTEEPGWRASARGAEEP